MAVLSLAIILGLSGCGGGDGKKGDRKNSSRQSAAGQNGAGQHGGENGANAKSGKTQTLRKGPTTNNVQPPPDNRTRPVEGSPEPTGPAPRLDPKASAARAIHLYDTTGDGALQEAELEASPALRAALVQMDADADGRLTPDEIASRIGGWQRSDSPTVPIRCRVTLDEKPLAGATVRFVPAPFLSGDVGTAQGITDADGVAELSPAGAKGSGVPCGLYRVEISKIDSGRETIPARYNLETTLGQEVFLDAPGIWSGIRFDLQTSQP